MEGKQKEQSSWCTCGAEADAWLYHWMTSCTQDSGCHNNEYQCELWLSLGEQEEEEMIAKSSADDCRAALGPCSQCMAVMMMMMVMGKCRERLKLRMQLNAAGSPCNRVFGRNMVMA